MKKFTYDFIQIFKFFVTDHQGLAKTEGIDFVFLQNIKMLVDTIGYLPSNS